MKLITNRGRIRKVILKKGQSIDDYLLDIINGIPKHKERFDKQYKDRSPLSFLQDEYRSKYFYVSGSIYELIEEENIDQELEYFRAIENGEYIDYTMQYVENSEKYSHVDFERAVTDGIYLMKK